MLLLVSYVPLLRGVAGHLLAPDLAARLFDSVGDAGHVDAVVWAGDGEQISPVFAMQCANEIVEHLVEFAEGSPRAWFTLHFDWNDDEYAMALVPDVQKSLDRFLVARSIASDRRDATPDDEVKVIFQPLIFRGRLSDVSRRALARLQGETTLGFLDVAVLSAGLDQLDLRDASRVGPLRCKRDPELLAQT